MDPNMKKYDLVIFGATGFTGQFVVEEIARTEHEEGKITWAIAGRNEAKLKKILKQASEYTGKDLSGVPVILADVSSESSLSNMCAQASIILNCVGPYQLYGEPVIKACIQNRTHHVDISGEPVFLENVQLEYDRKARETGVYIMEACGFDSIPADMGVVYTRDQFQGDLNHIEGVVGIHLGAEGGRFNSGTWSSAVHGFASARKLKEIRKKLFTTPVPRGDYRVPKRPSLFYNKETQGWCTHFIGADRSIVSRSQRYNYEHRKERPIQFAAYMQSPSLLTIFMLIPLALTFIVLVQFEWGRRFMIKHPRLSSFGLFHEEGPTRKQMAGASFSMRMIGHGYPDKLSCDVNHSGKPSKKIVTKISGPEIGYVTTPICLVQAAYTMMKEKDKLPDKGGVFTPGAAFAKTSLIQRLKSHNVKFETISHV